MTTLSEFAGLSRETIVMDGFGDYFQEDLREIGKLFVDEPLPAWDKQCAFSRKGINYAQRTCLQSLYTAASRAMVALYIIDSQAGFLRQIVANSCQDMPVASAAAARVSTPKEWFERAYSDFSNNLIDNARSILSDEIKMGDAYQKINEALQSYGLAAVFSVPFPSYLPVEMTPQPSAAGGAYTRAGSNSPPPKAVQASAAGGGPVRHKSKSPPLQGRVLSPEDQTWVNEFSLTAKTAQKLKELFTMEDKWPHFRVHLLFVAEVQDGKGESIFIKCAAETAWLRALVKQMVKTQFVAEITPWGLNYMCKGQDYFNMSPTYFLCAYPEGIALLSKNPDLVAKIDKKALNTVLPDTAVDEAGMSGAYFLCGFPEGRALLGRNPGLVAKIDEKALNAVLPESAKTNAGTSCALILCVYPEGLALLRGNSGLVAKIDKEALNALLPVSAGPDLAGKSGAYFLCYSREGRVLLGRNPDLVAKIDKEALNAVLPESAEEAAGMSCAYFLCASPEGVALLGRNPGLAAKIDKEALNAVLPESAGASAGKSGKYLLCASPDGRVLLKSNARLRSMINTARGWPFSSDFKDDNKGETIESWLAQYNEEGELASNSPSAASVSMFTTKPESQASSPSSSP